MKSDPEIILKLKGPFGLTGQKSLFEAKEINLSGLYIFTFKIEKKYLIEYVGITARDFKTRFLEHIRELLSGGYRLYDLQKLENDEFFLIWKGRYDNATYNIADFLDNYSHFSGIINKQFQELKIFLIPLNVEKRTLERIEGEIYKILRKQNDKRVMTFIKGVRSRPRIDKEQPITVKVEPNNLLPEIPDNFEA